MYYDFPAQILQLNLIFFKNQHKDTIIFRDMQLFSLIYIISRHLPKQNNAKLRNKISPNCGKAMKKQYLFHFTRKVLNKAFCSSVIR